MSDADFKATIFALRDTWAQQSNATEDQQRLLDLCGQFITDMDTAIANAGGHPTPPPPRVVP